MQFAPWILLVELYPRVVKRMIYLHLALFLHGGCVPLKKKPCKKYCETIGMQKGIKVKLALN